MAMMFNGSRTPVAMQGNIPVMEGVQQQTQPAPRSGMFGGLSKKQLILGGIMDAIGQLGGRQPSFLPMAIQQHQQDRQEEREDERWAKRFELQAAAKQVPSQSTAAKMAVEAGLTPGTVPYQRFITRYAFSPRLVSVGNDRGGTDQVEYDPSGTSGGLPDGYNSDEWEVVE